MNVESGKGVGSGLPFKKGEGDLYCKSGGCLKGAFTCPDILTLIEPSDKYRMSLGKERGKRYLASPDFRECFWSVPLLLVLKGFEIVLQGFYGTSG